MAGSGYKLFSTGDVLSAADVNTYFMQQTIMAFADAAARTTALTSVLAEGMVSYLRDTNVVQVYNGSAWIDISDDLNAIQNTIVDAKGDLIGATAADTPARLAVGANDTVLVADSTAATGLAWKSSATRYPWTAYTTTTGNMTVGNGTLTARYQQIGKTVNVFVQFTLGSTSAISTTPYFSLPVTAAQDKWSITGRLGDNGVQDYFGFAQANTANVFIYALGASGTYGTAPTVSATVPFTWATGDFFTFSFSYEAA